VRDPCTSCILIAIELLYIVQRTLAFRHGPIVLMNVLDMETLRTRTAQLNHMLYWTLEGICAAKSHIVIARVRSFHLRLLRSLCFFISLFRVRF
jgi:hypothetical protein